MKIILVLILLSIVLMVILCVFPSIEGKYNAGIFHYLCDSEQYILIESGEAHLISFHPDKTDRLLFTYRKSEWNNIDVTMSTHLSELIGDNFPKTFTLTASFIGIHGDQQFFDHLDIEPGLLKVFMGRYCFFGN